MSERGDELPRPGGDADGAPALLVGPGGRFEGLVVFRGSARLSGEVEGEIVCRGTLEVDEGARVSGDVEGDELIVGGLVEGRVVAHRRLEVRSTGRVAGGVSAPRIALEDGCVLDGRCETGRRD